jgi:hypothetical protein
MPFDCSHLERIVHLVVRGDRESSDVERIHRRHNDGRGCDSDATFAWFHGAASTSRPKPICCDVWPKMTEHWAVQPVHPLRATNFVDICWRIVRADVG